MVGGDCRPLDGSLVRMGQLEHATRRIHQLEEAVQLLDQPRHGPRESLHHVGRHLGHHDHLADPDALMERRPH